MASQFLKHELRSCAVAAPENSNIPQINHALITSPLVCDLRRRPAECIPVWTHPILRPPRHRRPLPFQIAARRFSPPLLCQLPKAHAWSATVLVDESQPGGLARFANSLQARHASPRERFVGLLPRWCHVCGTKSSHFQCDKNAFLRVNETVLKRDLLGMKSVLECAPSWGNRTRAT